MIIFVQQKKIDDNKGKMMIMMVMKAKLQNFFNFFHNLLYTSHKETKNERN